MNPSTPTRRPFVPHRLLIAAVATAVLAGCASTSAPVVYPVADAQRSQRADADLQACRAEAESAVGIRHASAQEAGTDAARRGAREFVDKAVETLVAGSQNAWARARGAGAGAMAGSLTSMALNWNEPDGVYRNYVELCLRERGHRVLGWR